MMWCPDIGISLLCHWYVIVITLAHHWYNIHVSSGWCPRSQSVHLISPKWLSEKHHQVRLSRDRGKVQGQRVANSQGLLPSSSRKENKAADVTPNYGEMWTHIHVTWHKDAISTLFSSRTSSWEEKWQNGSSAMSRRGVALYTGRCVPWWKKEIKQISVYHTLPHHGLWWLFLELHQLFKYDASSGNQREHDNCYQRWYLAYAIHAKWYPLPPMMLSPKASSPPHWCL